MLFLVPFPDDHAMSKGACNCEFCRVLLNLNVNAFSLEIATSHSSDFRGGPGKTHGLAWIEYICHGGVAYSSLLAGKFIAHYTGVAYCEFG